MSNCSRESTEEEVIINQIWYDLRNLDKLTWNYYNKIETNGEDLIEDAKHIIVNLGKYIESIKQKIATRELKKLIPTKTVEEAMNQDCYPPEG